jgi:hypothetical protein
VIIFIVSGISINKNNPEQGWTDLLEKEIELTSTISKVNTYGMDPFYFFIRTITRLYENQGCSQKVFEEANKIYQNYKQAPIDY